MNALVENHMDSIVPLTLQESIMSINLISSSIVNKYVGNCEQIPSLDGVMLWTDTQVNNLLGDAIVQQNLDMRDVTICVGNKNSLLVDVENVLKPVFVTMLVVIIPLVLVNVLF